MKKIIITTLTVLTAWLFLPIYAQQTYYYYSGLKIPLEYSTKRIYIKFKETASIENKKELLSVLPFRKKIDTIAINNGVSYAIVELLETKNKDEIQQILSSINNDANTTIALPYLQSSDGKTLIGITELFFVKLNSPADFSILKRLIEETNTIILRQNEFIPEIYEIIADKNAKGNALEMANYFYEKGNFVFSTPDLIYKLQMNCANDSLFHKQWGLKNNGDNNGIIGVDLNICDAWNITKGCSNIKIAVLDEGVDLNHPDLIENLLEGFDATNQYSNGVCEGDAAHGTCCAGIIAAKSNTKGISGVAPDCKIIPIRIPDYSIFYPQGTSSDIAYGISKAVELGADILSNSWSIDPNYPHDYIDAAIENAITSGRGGLGCIVVCASSNDNTIVQYPACLPKTIAVGAIDRCGIRAGRIDIIPNSCDPWEPGSREGSCYGVNLDIVAPGSSICTTDISGSHGYNSGGDYVCDFGGTSAACPFVAGVAALVLSVNPNLTYNEVYKYIMLGCDKTGGYSYNFRALLIINALIFKNIFLVNTEGV